MNDNDEKNKEAKNAVVRFLVDHGFVVDGPHFRNHNEVRVTSDAAGKLSRPVDLRVHGATQPPDCAVLGGNKPPVEDIVAFCWLNQPPGARFLFITRQEAKNGWLTDGKVTQGWHVWPPGGTFGFYGDNDSPPKPNEESVRKILGEGGP